MKTLSILRHVATACRVGELHRDRTSTMTVVLHVALLVLGRPPALALQAFPKVVEELKEWAHSHFSDCLVEFNTTQPSGTSSSCKLSEGANSVQGHNVILGLAVHGVPSNKRDLPPALVFCTDRLHAAHKQELDRLYDKYATTEPAASLPPPSPSRMFAAVRGAKCACARSENIEENTSFSLGNSVLGFLQRHWFTLIYSLFLQRLVSRAWFLGE